MPIIRSGDEAILEGIGEVARRHLDWHGEIRSEQRIVETLSLDSLRRLTLLVEIENRFRVRLDEESEDRLETVGDLVLAVRRQLDGNGRDPE